MKRWFLVCWCGLVATSPALGQVQFINDYFTTDAQFNAAYGGQGTNFESFGGEGRAGNRTLTGDYEYNINRLNSPGNFQFGVVTGQRIWASGTTYQFRLEYSGDATKQIQWRIFSATDDPARPTITTSAVFGQVATLFVRTAVSGGSDDRSLLVNNLVFNGTPLVGAQSFSNSASVRPYLRIYNVDLTQPWILTGEVTPTWGPTPPTGAQFNFQVKAMQIPEPTTIGLCVIAAAGGLGFLRYRRRSHQLEADAEAADAELPE